MVIFRAPTLMAVFLLAVLLLALVMGAPVWMTVLLTLVVLLYGGILFSKRDEKAMSAKKGKVVCWNCRYDNKTGKFICKQCKVRL